MQPQSTSQIKIPFDLILILFHHRMENVFCTAIPKIPKNCIINKEKTVVFPACCSFDCPKEKDRHPQQVGPRAIIAFLLRTLPGQAG